MYYIVRLLWDITHNEWHNYFILVKLTPSQTQMNAGHFEFVDSHTGKSILDFENKKPISVQGEFDSKSLETNIIHTSKVNNKNIKFVLNVSLLL